MSKKILPFISKKSKNIWIIYVLFVILIIGFLFGIFYVLDFSRNTHIVDEKILKKNTEQYTNSTKIGFASLMKNPIDLPLWLKYHRNLGISKFFIRLEDSPSWEEYLKDMKDVVVEIGNSDESGNNYTTLIDRQKTFVDKVLNNTQNTKDIDWLIHIDADELLHGDLSAITNLSDSVKTFKMVNAEAVFDESNKKNTCFSATKFLRCDQGAPCKSYVNGKSGGRTNTKGIYLAGPHDFGFSSEEKQMKTQILHDNIPFEKLHILHFEGCSFGGWVEKYYHLSKNDNNDMPFPYYKESIVASKKAHELYKENKMPNTQQFDQKHTYSLYSPIKI
jgi:hypothetical protein